MLTLNQKRILITGASGFIGTSLSDRLGKMGAKVIKVSRTGGNGIKMDILNYKKIKDLIKKEKIQVVIHLASEAIVEKGQEDPYITFTVNTQGTLNILESARINKVERVIIASTAHVYGDNKIPYMESYVPRPTRPYETSKACADLIAMSYAQTYKMSVLIPRFVNIYGPGDLNFTRLIPRTIKSVIEDKSPQMWGEGTLRDYLFIEDALKAYVRLCTIEDRKIEKEYIYNFGTGEIISVENLIKKIIRTMGANLKIEKVKTERTNEIKKQYVSWEKAKEVLDWNPKTSLDEGLKKTIDWYRGKHIVLR